MEKVQESLGEMLVRLEKEDRERLRWREERPFWVPYCGYGPGWCLKKEACRGKKMFAVRGCRFLRMLHAWTGLGPDEWKAIVLYAYHHPLKVKTGRRRR